MSASEQIGTHAPDLAAGERMIAVVVDLRRQVESRRQSSHAVFEQVFVAAVRFFGVAKPAYCLIVHNRPRYIVS